ncbi:hypothetical protein AGLY_017240 [Aphis glycines]|uniref:Uncharacterized protein n=1 Tax=Aphis glycines TaxID=307491 RepID=A0A6G0SVS0_APHGL|nr:hypothetical protein AGLY_017240 [Aphis glycines]
MYPKHPKMKKQILIVGFTFMRNKCIISPLKWNVVIYPTSKCLLVKKVFFQLLLAENIICVTVENFNIMPPTDTFFFRGNLYKDRKVLTNLFRSNKNVIQIDIKKLELQSNVILDHHTVENVILNLANTTLCLGTFIPNQLVKYKPNTGYTDCNVIRSSKRKCPRGNRYTEDRVTVFMFSTFT